MGSLLAEYLKGAGIRLQEDEFLALVHESLERVVGSAKTTDASQLPPEERKRLEQGGFRFERPEADRDDPVVRGATEFAALMGSALTVAQAAKRLGVNAARIRQRLSGPRRTLYGIKRDGEWWLPRFQFARRGLLSGIGDVVAALDPGLHPVAVSRWLTTPNPDLVWDGEDQPLSPLDWLRAGGDPEEVSALASHL